MVAEENLLTSNVVEKEVEKAPEPIKVMKWDSPTVRIALSDVGRKVLMAKDNWNESQRVADIKILISLVAVIFSGYCCYYDYIHPFPESRMVITVCATSYFVFITILTAYTYFIENNLFYQGAEKITTFSGKGKKEEKMKYWKFSSEMGKYDDKFTIVAEYHDGKRSGTLRVTKSIGCYITEDGQIIEKLVADQIDQLIDDSHRSN
uniref:Signal peptidase complex subunit 2 n=1 Tax=Rhabditophanes sp. KR3021 TaxID=114890 RepID=A0AC35UE58_9BILA